jgi:hypothetical protein
MPQRTSRAGQPSGYQGPSRPTHRPLDFSMTYFVFEEGRPRVEIFHARRAQVGHGLDA